MNQFLNKKIDVLVCTTIIESGVDIPSVNTLFVNNADHFGLGELHQLRGRVGRYRNKAYAYFLIPAKRPIILLLRRDFMLCRSIPNLVPVFGWQCGIWR